MAKMWVQLKSAQNIEVQGKLKRYQPGDWVAVGKQVALRWISEGSAWIPEGQAADLLSVESGFFLYGDTTNVDERLGDYAGQVETREGAWPELAWAKTMIYNPGLRLRRELVPVGFHLLDTWQAAIPIYDYDKLASGQGSEDDRARTQAVVRDLRVPLYSPELMFVRRCPDTQRLMDTWKAEQADGGDIRFGLLRAIYRVKPLILALPTTWLWKDMQLE